MAVEFRCEKCGKLLSVDAQPDSKIKCPYCKAKVVVPAGVASLPRPQVPGAVPPPPVSQGQAQQAEQAEQPAEGEEAVMGVMAAAMPWLISVFLHAGLLVILAFITIMMFMPEAPVEYNATSDLLSDNPGGQLNPGQMNREMEAHSLQRINQRRWSKRDSQIPMAAMGKTNSRIQVFGIGGASAGGGSADFGLTTGGSGAGPKSRFFGTGGSAYHIVYLVDRSGSMLESFDLVRKELLRSISRLSEQQTFHVIFFNDGDPVENGPRRLVPATTDYKREAAANLMKIQAFSKSGVTDPIPAIKRAFEVLSRVRSGKKQKLIYLLTDGEFQNNEKVRKTIRALNKDGQVHVNTILYVVRNPEFEQFLRQIAQENGGKFKFVERDE